MVFTIVNYKTPSPGGRELEGGGFHPHLNPLPSRARNFIRDYALNYTCMPLAFSFQLFDEAFVHGVAVFHSGETKRFNFRYVTRNSGLNFSS